MIISDAIFAARYVAGAVTSEDIVTFADSRLSDGVYSDHYLAILDEEQKSMGNLSEYLELAFKQFDVPLPIYENAIWQLVEYHIELILSESLTPREGFLNLLNDISDFDLHKGIEKYVGDNIGIAKMYGQYYSVDDGAKIDDVNFAILKECQNWKRNYGGRH